MEGDEGAAAERSTAKRGRGGGVKESGDGTEQPPPQGASSSRIYRVKATGGKDRHSKVCTTKGVRDRRVRLSVPTAIQLYDLQDRLGYDQPSKAVDWLINAASAAIDELPPLDPASFAPPVQNPEQDAAGKEMEQQQHATKSPPCSSTSSKGSDQVVSLSDKEVTVASTPAQVASFTELLTAGNDEDTDIMQPWQPTPVSAVAADCVGIAAQPGKGAAQGLPSTYTVSSTFGNASPIGMVSAPPQQPFNNFTSSSSQMTQFSLVQDALAAGASSSSPAAAGDYSLDFPMSSGTANRGTLQSNSPQPQFSVQLHQLHELDGPSSPFFYAATDAAARPASTENHLTASAALQLWKVLRYSSDMTERSRN